MSIASEKMNPYVAAEIPSDRPAVSRRVSNGMIVTTFILAIAASVFVGYAIGYEVARHDYYSVLIREVE